MNQIHANYIRNMEPVHDMRELFIHVTCKRFRIGFTPVCSCSNTIIILLSIGMCGVQSPLLLYSVRMSFQVQNADHTLITKYIFRYSFILYIDRALTQRVPKSVLSEQEGLILHVYA
jgi:hypothetical protein